MLTCKILNSLEKVFPDCEPKGERVELSMLKGETASFQIAVKTQGKVRISVDAEGFTTRIRRIVEVPVNLPVWPTNPDTDYLRRTPGLFPDVLREMPQGNIMQITGWWRSFWVDVEPLEETCGGDHKIKVKVERLDWDGEPAETYSSVLSLHYVAAALPPQKLIQTKWFHADCLADYYHVDVFSEDWWRIVENFVSCAVRMGINMILTPIITPALDTYVGGERTTVQLIDVRVDNGKYSFNFDLLKRWVDMCLRCGVEYFEIAHLYSQWGAKFAPKVMATVDGEYRRIFGWETPALGGAYKDFLAELLPQLDKALKEMGIAHRCRFHVSDEPHEDALDHYTAVRDQAKVYLKDYVFMDALSHFDFYKAGAVDIPVVASDSGDMQKFLDSDIKGLWIYYCCGQSFEVSNGFIAMPSQRTRILGTQLYLYGMGGFLQWGYNFYNSSLSIRHIDPYLINDGDSSFPAGDPFIVYPGEGGIPEESLRYMAMRQGMHDIRAMELLESLTDKEFVKALVRRVAGCDITLREYPRDLDFLPNLREAVNREIELRTAKAN